LKARGLAPLSGSDGRSLNAAERRLNLARPFKAGAVVDNKVARRVSDA